MKFAASILIIYFSAMISQPYVNVWLGLRNKHNSCVPAPKSKCCKEMAKHKDKAPAKEANTCNRDLCNPFMPCGISVPYKISACVFENRVFDLARNLKTATNDAIISNYHSDCWRPPEFA